MPATTPERPSRSADRDETVRAVPPRRAPLPVAAAVAALWAALVSYLPVALVLWLARLAEGDGSMGDAARIGLAGWLLGHGVPLETATGPLGLAPLALAVLAIWRVSRAGVHVSRAVGARRSGSMARAGAVALAVGVAYGGVGVVAAVAAGSPSISVSPPRAGFGLAVFGALAALVGALRTTGALGGVARWCPAVLRHGTRTGVVAALLVLGAGAGVTGLSVAISGADAGDTIGAYRTGAAGQAGITLVSVAYAPNATVWAASYLLGPGFALGADTAVRTSEVTLGTLPAVPLFAGLPNGPTGGVSAALLAVPVLAGMTAGWLLVRRRLREISVAPAPVGWSGLLTGAAVAGPVAGVLLGVVAIASGGPLGAGRLAEIGPVGWQVALAATGVVTSGSLIGALAARAVAAPVPALR